MESKHLLSVIVPVYHVEQYLPKCVDSLLAQTYENLEIILVDDGSGDRCGAICDAYAARDDRVRVIHKENGGLSSARNAGIEAAQGEYLTFVDSDDWVEPEAYEVMLSLMEVFGVKLVCAGRYDVSEATGEKTVGLCPPREEKITGTELARRIFTWDGIDSAACDKVYHRSLFRQIRYPLGVVAEDLPTTYRIALDAGWAAMCPRPFYNYFHRGGSITTAVGISEKTFHFVRHTEKIDTHIRQEHPELAGPARYLRVRSLVYTLELLDMADREDRARFRAEQRRIRRQLWPHMAFLLTAPWFRGRERGMSLLLAAGVFRPAWTAAQWMKKRRRS